MNHKSANQPKKKRENDSTLIRVHPRIEVNFATTCYANYAGNCILGN